VFTLNAPEADTVFLCGDFNNWDEKKHPMKKDQWGLWKKEVILSPGRYEYKFKVDGRWQIDPENRALCQNDYGTLNHVIEIKSV
jgi:1,4-alpha-glucan branching enzyme